MIKKKPAFKYERKKLKKVLEDEKIFHASGLIDNVKMMILTQNTLQIQWNPHQNYNDIQYRNRKNNPRTHVETQKIAKQS